MPQIPLHRIQSAADQDEAAVGFQSVTLYLTDAALERYRPKSARDEIFDKQARGHGVRVTAASKSFFFIRRVKGQKVRFTLGQYPVLSLASVRKQAFDIIEKIKDGGDQCDEYARLAA